MSNGTSFHRLELRYFDHLLQANISVEASCESPVTALQTATPLVFCRTAGITVKLPPGTRLMRVKALGKDADVGAVTTTSPGAEFVRITTAANTVRECKT